MHEDSKEFLEILAQKDYLGLGYSERHIGRHTTGDVIDARNVSAPDYERVNIL